MNSIPKFLQLASPIYRDPHLLDPHPPMERNCTTFKNFTRAEKEELFRYLCDSVRDQINRELQEAKKAARRLKDVAEGREEEV